LKIHPTGNHTLQSQDLDSASQMEGQFVRVERDMITRRSFVSTSSTIGAGLALGFSCDAQLVTEIKCPEMVIDTHTHFYDPSRNQGVPWPTPEEKELYRPVYPENYKNLNQPCKVTGTVVVEASAWLDDNQWILDLAAKDPFIVGFVGNISLGEANFQAELDKLAKNKIFRGIRLPGTALKEALQNSEKLDRLKHLAALDLSLDVLGNVSDLDAVARISDKIPQLRMIVDHVANVKIDGKTPPQAWLTGMNALKSRPNVFAKLSGLVEGTGKRDGTTPSKIEFYRPILDYVWEVFGQKRVVYGSNWPVSGLFAPCDAVLILALKYSELHGDEAMNDIFAGNASRCYKWLNRGLMP
jgi:L-fuconolactonase